MRRNPKTVYSRSPIRPLIISSRPTQKAFTNLTSRCTGPASERGEELLSLAQEFERRAVGILHLAEASHDPGLDRAGQRNEAGFARHRVALEEHPVEEIEHLLGTLRIPRPALHHNVGGVGDRPGARARHVEQARGLVARLAEATRRDCGAQGLL